MATLADLAFLALRHAEPEWSHRVTIAALRRGFAAASGPDDPRLHTSLATFRLTNPIGLAAGFDKNASALRGLAASGFGFIEAGTVTIRAQAGNPRPRLFRLPEEGAIINRMGFNNAGIDVFRHNLDARGVIVPVGANIGLNGDSVEPENDYAALVGALAGQVAYVAINVSSPNTPGLRELQAPKRLGAILHTIQRKVQFSPPLFVKLAPDVPDHMLPDIVAACVDAGAAGLIVCNTTVARSGTLRGLYASERGGLSGAPLKTRSLSMLREVARVGKGRLTLIGVGGIASGADVLERLRSGAAAVQIYTALALQGPKSLRRIKRELLAELDAAGFRDVSGAMGS